MARRSPGGLASFLHVRARTELALITEVVRSARERVWSILSWVAAVWRLPRIGIVTIVRACNKGDERCLEKEQAFAEVEGQSAENEAIGMFLVIEVENARYVAGLSCL